MFQNPFCFALPLVVCLGFTAPASAQTPAPGTTPAASADGSPERRIERIRIEDAGARVDELRVGGETQSITVSPKGGMPAYELLPPGTNQGLAAGPRNSSATSGGTRVWKILGF